MKATWESSNGDIYLSPLDERIVILCPFMTIHIHSKVMEGKVGFSFLELYSRSKYSSNVHSSMQEG
jgi:hypothetical protein